MPTMTEDAHRVVIAGGGVAALEAMLALDALAGDRVEVTLVCPDDDFSYRPLSTGEAFDVSQVTTYSVGSLAGEHGARLVMAAVASVDPGARTVATYDGETLEYDSLLVALGASRDIALEEALTFVDQRSVPGFRDLLDAIRTGHVHSVAFLVPRGVVWPFPLYELALMTGELVRDQGLQVELTLVTPASGPLALFGPEAEQAMSQMLADRGVSVRAGSAPEHAGPGRVLLQPDGEVLVADRFVALPRLTGPRLAGLPHDRDGFIPVDDRGRVPDAPDVYAAGDCATYPFKQGGLAAQQADVVAQAIAARVGAAEEPAGFRPVLRGLLLTGGDGRRFLRRPDLDVRAGEVAGQELWWPPTKIAGRYLAPALGALDHGELMEQAPEPGGVLVELEVEPGTGSPPA
jgi:sulfide:quinone oxidoreductase